MLGNPTTKAAGKHLGVLWEGFSGKQSKKRRVAYEKKRSATETIQNACFQHQNFRIIQPDLPDYSLSSASGGPTNFRNQWRCSMESSRSV